jgi:hypothetical protein
VGDRITEFQQNPPNLLNWPHVLCDQGQLVAGGEDGPKKIWHILGFHALDPYDRAKFNTNEAQLYNKTVNLTTKKGSRQWKLNHECQRQHKTITNVLTTKTVLPNLLSPLLFSCLFWQHYGCYFGSVFLRMAPIQKKPTTVAHEGTDSFPVSWCDEAMPPLDRKQQALLMQLIEKLSSTAFDGNLLPVRIKDKSTTTHVSDAQSYPSVRPSLGMWKPSIFCVTSFTLVFSLPFALGASLSSALVGLSCQILMVPSSDPDAYDSPPGAKRTQWTGPWCPLLHAAWYKEQWVILELESITGY